MQKVSLPQKASAIVAAQTAHRRAQFHESMKRYRNHSTLHLELQRGAREPPYNLAKPEFH
jgi:hypothetical protein